MLDIKDIRKRLGFSQEDMAKALGITQASYSFKESGIRKFSIKELKILKRTLNVTYEELLGD